MNRARAVAIVARYPYPKSAILPLAHLAQDEEGWLSNEAMKEIAELTGVTAADVLGTCSFYTMFKRRPCGRLVVSVCTNVTCLVTGGPAILEDPATGSACANLGGWFSVIEPRAPIKRTVAQGDAVQRPSTLYLNVEWDTSNPRIFVGGDVIELGRGSVNL